MKKTDLEKAKALKLVASLQNNATPARFGGATETLTRRERRTRDQEQGLIPFAIKLDEGLVKQVRLLATSRKVTIDALVSELLTQALKDT